MRNTKKLLRRISFHTVILVIIIRCMREVLLCLHNPESLKFMINVMIRIVPINIKYWFPFSKMSCSVRLRLSE